MDHPADEWSDLDIIIYAKDHKTYLSDTDWLENIGNVWITFTYHTASGQPERLILFEGSFQVDMVFLPCKDLYQMVKDRITPDNFYRGVRVLIDKDNISGYIVPSSFRPALSFSIDETVFLQTVNMIWFGSIYVAKQLLRGELWLAKTRENELKSLLLQMMEWHAKAMYGKNYDVWYAGRFLHEWLDQNTLDELKNTFGYYEKADSFRALSATINLFRRLSVETAGKLNFRYPFKTDKHITDWITENINTDSI